VRLRPGSRHSTENARDASHLTAAGASATGPCIHPVAQRAAGWLVGVETLIPRLRHVAPRQSTRQLTVIYRQLRPLLSVAWVGNDHKKLWSVSQWVCVLFASRVHNSSSHPSARPVTTRRRHRFFPEQGREGAKAAGREHATAAGRGRHRGGPWLDHRSLAGPSKATRNRQLTAVAETMAAAAPSSARGRAPPRPLHPLARGGSERQEMEAVAATHPGGAQRMRRKGRKQKQVRTSVSACLPPCVLLLCCRFCLFRGDWWWCLLYLCCPDTQLWPRTVLRKWLNIRSPESDFSADEGDTTGDDTDSEVEYEGGRYTPHFQVPTFQADSLLPSSFLYPFWLLHMTCLIACLVRLSKSTSSHDDKGQLKFRVPFHEGSDNASCLIPSLTVHAWCCQN